MTVRTCALALFMLFTSPLVTAETAAQQAVKAAQESGRNVDASVVRDLAAKGALLLDMRGEDEWRAGRIAGAQHAHWFSVAGQAEKHIPDKNTPIVTYCAVGARARMAATRLRWAGYTHVTAMNEGGYAELVKAGLPSAR